MSNKEKEDRFSDMPDSLIHLILSFLLSTKQAIQTGILSKRWLNQWTFVSNLIFDFSGIFSDSDYSPENIPFTTSTISRIVDHTLFLHQCSKIQKFQIITGRFYEHEYDPNFEDKIRLAVRKQVEELILKFIDQKRFRLPEFFFSQPSLVKLQLRRCAIRPTGVLNWTKDLSIENCDCTDEAIRSIVSDSPLLQSLEVNFCVCRLSQLVIASKSLKRLVVINILCYADIWCPNLVEFYGCRFAFENQSFGWCVKVLERFLSDSPLLESLELKYFKFSNVRIASEIMKKFVFKGWISHEIVISCRHLEDLGLSRSLQSIRVMNLPPLVCASLDPFYHDGWKETDVKHILESVQHLNELKLESYFIKALSALEMDGVSNL